MKFFFLLLISFTVCCKSNKQAISCERLKTGKFGFWGNGSNREYFIQRNDSVQIERDDLSGTVIEFNIKWLSPCEYELVFKRFVKKGNDSLLFKDHKYPIVRTVIHKITPDYYVFTSRVEGLSDELTDTMGISKFH